MGFSLVHWAVLLIFGLLWVVPIARICRRVGLSQAWAVLGFLPVIGVFALWVVAFSAWKVPDADLRR